MRRALLLLLTAALLLAVPGGAAAHFATVSFLEVTASRQALDARLLLDPYHLRTAVDLDGDGDGTIVADEVEAAAAAIRDLVGDGLVARAAGQPLPVQVGRPALTTAATLTDPDTTIQPDFALVEVPLRFEVGGGASTVSLAYDLFLQPGVAEPEPHVSLVRVDVGGQVQRHAFSRDTPTLSVALPADATAVVVPLLGGVLGLGAVLAAVLRWAGRSSRRGGAPPPDGNPAARRRPPAGQGSVATRP